MWSPLKHCWCQEGRFLPILWGPKMTRWTLAKLAEARGSTALVCWDARG
jgi:hypothetical protein